MTPICPKCGGLTVVVIGANVDNSYCAHCSIMVMEQKTLLDYGFSKVAEGLKVGRTSSSNVN